LPVVGNPGSNVLVRAFERAWRNFVELLAGFIASLGVLVPLVLAGGRRYGVCGAGGGRRVQ